MLEETGVSFKQLEERIVNNMCIKENKITSRVVRDVHADIKERELVKDEIRRIYNGGYNFHPYL